MITQRIANYSLNLNEEVYWWHKQIWKPISKFSATHWSPSSKECHCENEALAVATGGILPHPPHSLDGWLNWVSSLWYRCCGTGLQHRDVIAHIKMPLISFMLWGDLPDDDSSLEIVSFSCYYPSSLPVYDVVWLYCIVCDGWLPSIPAQTIFCLWCNPCS